MFQGKAQAAQDRHDLAMAAAWTAAACGRAKKMPRLADLTRAPKAAPKKVPWQSLYAAAASWAAAKGTIRSERAAE